MLAVVGAPLTANGYFMLFHLPFFGAVTDPSPLWEEGRVWGNMRLVSRATQFPRP